MIPERPALERRVLAALDAVPRRIPILLGGSGMGRTSVLLRLQEHLGRPASQYVDVERIATTPEECLRAVVEGSPFPGGDAGGLSAGGFTPRAAFHALLGFLANGRTPAGGPATFLLDELLELKTFESFPGLRTVLRDVVTALEGSENRFVLASRYTTRALRLLKDASAQFEMIHVPPLTAVEVGAALREGKIPETGANDEIARALHALADGRPSHVRALVTTIARDRSLDPVAALAEQMSVGGSLAEACRFCYELRLHRARGYGALKAILHVLGEEEPLTLTEIAQRLRRTPGSTKDYLSWLEDVDLIAARQKRYAFVDPILRLWVRLHCRATPPTDEDVAREVHRYALARLPRAEPALAAVGGGTADRPRPATTDPWNIIDID